MQIKIATTHEERNAAYAVRNIVFVLEQHVPKELEIDDLEEESIHFVCMEKEAAIGASRLRLLPSYGKLERICVLKEFRGQSIGKKIIEHMESEIVKKGLTHAKLNAQTHAASFYEALGYQVISEEFMDAGIPHVTMEKVLS